MLIQESTSHQISKRLNHIPDFYALRSGKQNLIPAVCSLLHMSVLWKANMLVNSNKGCMIHLDPKTNPHTEFRILLRLWERSTAGFMVPPDSTITMLTGSMTEYDLQAKSRTDT